MQWTECPNSINPGPSLQKTAPENTIGTHSCGSHEKISLLSGCDFAHQLTQNSHVFLSLQSRRITVFLPSFLPSLFPLLGRHQCHANYVTECELPHRRSLSMNKNIWSLTLEVCLETWSKPRSKRATHGNHVYFSPLTLLALHNWQGSKK